MVCVPGAIYCCSKSKIAFDFGPGNSVFTEAFFVIVSLSIMFFRLSIDNLCNMFACLLAHGREAVPVIDVDNCNAAIPADDCVAAVDKKIQGLGRGRRKLA